MGRRTILAVSLLVLAVCCLGKAVTPKKQVCQPEACKPKPLGSEFELEVVRLTNEERVSRGLRPLKVEAKMMYDARSWSHVQANSRMHHSRMGYGENVAYGQDTPREVMNAWMNSRGHRQNILNPSYSSIGVGAVSSGRAIFWTQVFR
jgi:uncharacterized protein YkwD